MSRARAQPACLQGSGRDCSLGCRGQGAEVRSGLQRPHFFLCYGLFWHGVWTHQAPQQCSVLSAGTQLHVAIPRLCIVKCRDTRQFSHSPLPTLWENIAWVSASGQTLLLFFSPASEPLPRDTQQGVTADPKGTLGSHQSCPSPSPFLLLGTSRLICGVGVQELSRPFALVL